MRAIVKETSSVAESSRAQSTIIRSAFPLVVLSRTENDKGANLPHSSWTLKSSPNYRVNGMLSESTFSRQANFIQLAHATSVARLAEPRLLGLCALI
jgi:hypothetical protein